jgi:hypothetical protein
MIETQLVEYRTRLIGLPFLKNFVEGLEKAA